MKKTLYFFLIIAAALIVVACGDRDDKELSSINPGLYEINLNLKYAGQLLILKQRARYNSDGTYEATNFQDNIAVDELKGKFKVEKNQLVSYDNQSRLITQDGTWIKKERSAVDVRKIKKGSYQYYFQYPDAKTREQYKGIGLSEGWKTYKRISD
ncbi:MAG: hypothetical protein NTW65_07000 [Deltaproteobacteria bacterium]|nr:hypothetical protein [Deltaproteobacteria bacterium]